PIFKDRYGVDTGDLGYVWIAGPLSGFIVQPVVGVLSDRSGQRRAFFLSGALVMAAAMLLLPNCGTVLTWLGTSSADVALALAVATLWVLDLAMNAGLVAVRAIIADAAPADQQAQANEAMVVAYGIGTLFGYILGSLDISGDLGMAAEVDNVVLLFAAAAAVLAATGAVAYRQARRLECTTVADGADAAPSTIGSGGSNGNISAITAVVPSTAPAAAARAPHGDVPVSSPPARPESGAAESLMVEMLGDINGCDAGGGNGSSNGGGGNGGGGDGHRDKMRELWKMAAFWRVPRWLAPVCVLLVFSWVAWFAVTIFGSDWVGTDVFGGDADASEGSFEYEEYEDGVEWASIGLAMQAAVVMGMGFGPVAYIWREFGLRGSFLLALATQGCILLTAVCIGGGTLGKAGTLLAFTLLGVPLALIETIPYLLVGMCSGRRRNGELLGKLNVYIVLGEVILTAAVAPLTKLTADNDVAVIAGGGVSALLGLVVVP
ncbi:unnamed protein product, partial [Phaeothamnion confervicola]